MSREQLVPSNRIRVFIDFWNLQLTLADRERKFTRNPTAAFETDWQKLPPVVASAAAEVAGVGSFAYEGSIVYVSYNAATDARFRHWLSTWLNRQPGVQVIAKERQAKRAPTCPNCRASISPCPYCGSVIKATVEKGVDTAMVTDMIRLAWEDAYDIGVIVSSDSDFVPVINFLDAKGRKMIQAGFPPQGAELATACWASFDLFQHRDHFRRPAS